MCVCSWVTSLTNVCLPSLPDQTMVTHGRVELLAHPLSQKYLQMKWNSYGKYFHLANLLIYSIFLVFVTIYSSLMMNNIELRIGGNLTTIQGCNFRLVGGGKAK